MAKLTIVADENMPAVDELFGYLGSIRKLPGRLMSAADVMDADVLLVRSVTQVCKELLVGSSVKFVGTATIGIDHLDTNFLSQNHIGWASAPGCNAVSVAEYVLSVLSHFCNGQLVSLKGKRAGVIGYGNVGQRVVERLQLLGMDVFAYDPLLDQAAHDVLSDLDSVLDCDVLCVHAPLTKSGAYPSFHMLQLPELQKLRQGAYLISAGRGGVVSNDAMQEMPSVRPDVRMAFDVWENEPNIDWNSVDCVEYASPHVAGYSFDGKVTGTRMLLQALQKFLGEQGTVAMDPTDDVIDINLSGIETSRQVAFAIHQVYDVAEDDKRFRDLLDMPVAERSAGFDALRKNYPMRRECSSYRLHNLSPTLISLCRGLGFRVENC